MRADRVWALALSLATGVVFHVDVVADDDGGDAVSAEQIGEGLRAIDMLEDLKAAYDQRLSDCLKAGQAQAYCQCVNSRATLDLTYDEYVGVVHDGDAGRAGSRFHIPTERAAEAIAAEPACRASP